MAGIFREGGPVRVFLRGIAVRIFERPLARGILNTVYNSTGWRGQYRIYRLFARIYRAGQSRDFRPGQWRVRFAGREVIMPLRKSEAWLDWDCALAMLGHDQEVKQTYEALLKSPLRPEAFLDVGANYGNHSVLMLVAGVPTVSVEPNPVCVKELQSLMALNKVQPILQTCALADHEGEVTLEFPERETWLGTIRLDGSAPAQPGLNTQVVPLRTLDALAPSIPPGRLLIKLDAEGAETAILRGGSQFLADRRPPIIFECWEDPASRRELQAAFPDFYTICHLPWSPDEPSRVIEPAAFDRAPGTNYIAVPADQIR